MTERIASGDGKEENASLVNINRRPRDDWGRVSFASLIARGYKEALLIEENVLKFHPEGSHYKVVLTLPHRLDM